MCSMATQSCTQLFWSRRRFLLAALLSPVVLGFVPPIWRHRACHGVEVRLDGLCGVRRRSVAVEMAKKKGIDAAKAAALAALEELENVEAAAMPAPAAATGPKKEDKKAKKDKKKEGKGGQGSEPAQAATPVAAAASPFSSAKAAREAALAALSAWSDEDEELDPKAARKAAKKAGKKGVVAPAEPSSIAAAAPKAEQRLVNVLQSMVEPMEETDSAPAAGAEEQHEDPVEEVTQEVTLEEKVRASRPPPRVRIATEGASGSVFLRLEKVSIVFRNQEVLKEASWGVQAGERVGVVGPNGAGKTTQLRIMAGELEPTSGEVVKSSKDMRVAFLRQEFVDELVPERALRNEFLSVFKEEHAVLDKLAQIEKDLAGATDNPDEMDRLLQELTDIQCEADRRQVYSLQNKVDKVMDSMGFLPSDADLPVRSFSGGWKMRIGLGKILLQEPSVLMLDEPTNHLDLDSVEWLESFLKNQQLPMVIVSHDREFLDRVCTKIVDTDGGECVSYTGNYSNFLKQKKARLEAWQRAFDNQQKKIQEDKEFINRFRSNSARSAQVKSREAALEKLMKSDDFIRRPPPQGSAFRFRFPPGPRLSGDVISIEHMTHGYGGQMLLDDTSLTVQKGDRVAIIGPNGVGKSTLLRLIMGIEKPMEGRASIVASNAVANYFEQNQADALDLDKTVDETIVEASSTESYNQLRSLMAQFMFKGDSIYKKVRQLSGGEKARVALCRMVLKPGNVLCLDEPTNHLDIPAKEILEEACREYEGAIMLISHDRYFVSQVANRIVAVEDKNLVVYEGDYKYYMDKNEEMASKIEKRYVDGVDGIKPAPQMRKDQLDKKNFGGKGGPSGNAKKGIKNAKRMQL